MNSTLQDCTGCGECGNKREGVWGMWQSGHGGEFSKDVGGNGTFLVALLVDWNEVRPKGGDGKPWSGVLVPTLCGFLPRSFLSILEMLHLL